MTVSVGRVRAVSGADAQVRGARSQHDSRRRGRVDSQCRVDEGGRARCDRHEVRRHVGRRPRRHRAAHRDRARRAAGRRSSRRAPIGAGRSSSSPRWAARPIGCSGSRRRPAAGDVEGAREHIRALLRPSSAKSLASSRHDDERAAVEKFIRQEFDELDRIVGALGVLREVTPRWLDAIAATGEMLSSRIVAAALTSHGLAASWVDARRVMVTNGEHTARGADLRRDGDGAGGDRRSAAGRRGAFR